MEWIWMALAGLISGILGSMGMGGGGVLIIYLTLIAGLDQRAAQGINLILFIPCAILALVCYIRKGLIDFRTALAAAAAGLVGALGGVFLSGWLEVAWLRRIFGIMLLFIGVRELFAKKPPAGEEEEEKKEERDKQQTEK
ncbi:sulfite exporter TauE/SafE family protein [Clostridium merdae]|uniref:sulfite exporter TauE/SafE family protein n=1 Tax=Clostridium merdae TaxID=1958780 RepID=UPI000A2671B4|nr:sulfite exporter TauE/SafE family protein [Clostridium merdae]